jgi:hypothetical protein
MSISSNLGIFFILTLATLSIILGFYLREALFVSVAGGIIGLLGSSIWINGLDNVALDVTNMLGMIMSILGGMIFMMPFFDSAVKLFNSLSQGGEEEW